MFQARAWVGQYSSVKKDKKYSLRLEFSGNRIALYENEVQQLENCRRKLPARPMWLSGMDDTQKSTGSRVKATIGAAVTTDQSRLHPRLSRAARVALENCNVRTYRAIAKAVTEEEHLAGPLLVNG